MVAQEKSILQTVKKMVGIDAAYEAFDLDIITHINTVFLTLQDLGMGPTNGFTITDENATWDDYVPNDNRVSAAKSYMYFAVRMAFDPPQSPQALGSMQKLLDELTFRINVRQEATNYFHEPEGVDISLPVGQRPAPVPTDCFGSPV